MTPIRLLGVIGLALVFGVGFYLLDKLLDSGGNDRRFRREARQATQTVFEGPVALSGQAISDCLDDTPLGGMSFRGGYRLKDGRRGFYSPARHVVVLIEDRGPWSYVTVRAAPDQTVASSTHDRIEACVSPFAGR